jgi:death-on-curing protein
MPDAGFGGRYLHGDLYEMAAAYLFHIIQNHPFVDGNKRTGLVAALVFLALNNVVIEAQEDDIERVVRAVAEGGATKATVGEFFRKHAQEGEGDVIA